MKLFVLFLGLSTLTACLKNETISSQGETAPSSPGSNNTQIDGIYYAITPKRTVSSCPSQNTNCGNFEFGWTKELRLQSKGHKILAEIRTIGSSSVESLLVSKSEISPIKKYSVIKFRSQEFTRFQPVDINDLSLKNSVWNFSTDPQSCSQNTPNNAGTWSTSVFINIKSSNANSEPALMISTSQRGISCNVALARYSEDLLAKEKTKLISHDKKWLRLAEGIYSRNPIPTNCVSWFDGCNECSKTNDGQVICTQRACLQYEEPVCHTQGD